jgi:glycogen debranching enzyme
MGETWTFSGEPVMTALGTVTLVEGSSFALSASTGDIAPDEVHGLFVDDRRLLSTWRVRVDGAPLHPLAVLEDLPFRATHLARVPGLDGVGDPGVVVERRRAVSSGMTEQLRIRNDGPRRRHLTVEVCVDADLAEVFEVKESRVESRPARDVEQTESGLRLRVGPTSVEVVAPGAVVVCESRRGQMVSTSAAPARLRWLVDLEPRCRWGVDLTVDHGDGGDRDHRTAGRQAAARLRTWTETTPVLTGGGAHLRTTVDTARTDLGALRMVDPAHPDEAAVAAGAPWFMALFGRDSLLASYMALPVDPRLASGSLRLLARHQGRHHDPTTEEQPGRILHELRFGTGPAERARAYYGSVDATPLFVVVLGELRRWGLGDEALQTLLPAADQALSWCEEHGDRDGDGFLEYLRSSESGLAHQGWRDSTDAITFADGTSAEAPLALAEAQAYWYAALRARAAIARSTGAPGDRWDLAADGLQRRFDAAFWLSGSGGYAVALDAEKRPVDAVTSAPGHCLWSGIVPSGRAPELAELLMSPELFSGWGLRTLATDMRAYDPLGYHSGGVWPHDTALAAAGLMRYGLTDAAVTLSVALLEAAGALGGRLPELLCGFPRDDYPAPIVYPAACSPQAWASAAPLLALRTLLRLDVDVPAGSLWFAPVVPAALRPLTLSQVPLGGCRVQLSVAEDGSGRVSGLPAHLAVHDRPRHPTGDEGVASCASR